MSWNIPDNTDDVIDSRDIISRLDDLETEWEDMVDADPGLSEDDFDDIDELRSLRALNQEGSDYCSDWQDGVTLVRDDYFTDYAREFINDVYVFLANLAPILKNNIDWDGVAEDLRADYTELDFDGVTYWAR